MKKRRQKSIFLLGVFLVFMILSACNESPNTPILEEAPEIPPESTFNIDFSQFGSTKSFNPTTEYNGKTQSSFLFSALTVGIWSTLVGLGMLIPSTAFVHALAQDPVRQDDGTWIWSYNFFAQGVRHTARLEASGEADGIRWDMFISRENGITDYHWFTGWSNITVTQGYWELNEAENETAFLRIDWTRSADNSAATIRYTDVREGAATNGNYIEYGVDETALYDARFEIFDTVENNLVTIEWNRTSGEGRVTAPNHFGDSDWHCWNAQRMDTDCPQG